VQKPKVSVIIPVYNAQKTVGNILEKLISQSYRNIEIVTVNDGSKDDSLKILQEFAKKDKRIIVIDQKNAGVSIARNVAITKVTGEFITFIDSDDDINDNLISELATHINDDSDFIMCGMSINNKEIVEPNIFIKNKSLITRYVLKSLLTKNLLYGPCCKLFRASIITHNNIQFPENVRYGEDTIFVLNYLRYANNITTIKRVLYSYNYQPSGLASTNNTNVAFRTARVDALKEFISTRNLSLLDNTFYLLLRSRWMFAIAKSLLRSNHV
jgi:glycosyltransferase involved in cell wall biosynthesis